MGTSGLVGEWIIRLVMARSSATGTVVVFHSVMTPGLNIGLLSPRYMRVTYHLWGAAEPTRATRPVQTGEVLLVVGVTELGNAGVTASYSHVRTATNGLQNCAVMPPGVLTTGR
jgi:hypothetical protein